VTHLGDHCFFHCSSLQTVTFSSGSGLDCIPEGAFAECELLESITVPASVKELGRGCFQACPKLVHSPLPPDSELVILGFVAFEGCSSLRSMCIPPSVEVVYQGCFEHCDSLLDFRFASPSHLRSIYDVPPGLSGFLSIPDSVELFWIWGNPNQPGLTFTFGSGSRLKEFHAVECYARTFLQAPTPSLKIFRRTLEFDYEDYYTYCK
jgi:hypothetical protein